MKAELDNAEKTAVELREHLDELQSAEEGIISDADIEEREELMQRLQEQYEEKEQLYEFIAELKATIEELNRGIERNKQLPPKTKESSEVAKLQAELTRVKKQNAELNQALSKERRKTAGQDESKKQREQDHR